MQREILAGLSDVMHVMCCMTDTTLEKTIVGLLHTRLSATHTPCVLSVTSDLD